MILVILLSLLHTELLRKSTSGFFFYIVYLPDGDRGDFSDLPIVF